MSRYRVPLSSKAQHTPLSKVKGKKGTRRLRLSLIIGTVIIALGVAFLPPGCAAPKPASETTAPTPSPKPTTETTKSPMPSVAFELSSLTVSPAEPGVWQTVMVAADVKNSGPKEDTQTVALKINGVTEGTTAVTLAAGKTQKVTFAFLKDTAGRYNLEVNGLNKTVTMKGGVLPIYSIGDSFVVKTTSGRADYKTTSKVIGEDMVAGKACYITETSFEPPMQGFVDSATMKLDKGTLMPLTMEFSGKINGAQVAVATSYSYQLSGDAFFPLQVGNQNRVTETASTTTTLQGKTDTKTETSVYTYKVESIEDITVTAGSFPCYRIVKYDANGKAVGIEWQSDKVKLFTVKSTNGDTSELISYSLGNQPGVQVLIYEDDFSTNRGWEWFGRGEVSVANGVYNVLTASRSPIIQSWYSVSLDPALSRLNDFSLEVDLAKVSGPDDGWYGIGFKIGNTEQMGFIMVSPKGTACFWKDKPQGYMNSIIVFEKPVPATVGNLRQARLRVERQGATWRIFVNDSAVALVSDISEPIKLCLDALGNNFNVTFDNLKVYAPAVVAGTARTGVINTGARVDLSRKSIGSSGGTITIDKPGDPLNDFQIEVPADSYKENRTFQISYAPIKNHTFGPNFNPISPLITVENGGGYSDDIMLVKIPVKVPEGHFAMGFFYDSKSGTLEGMPLVAIDKGSITVATRHFTDFIISSIAKYLLKGEIDSGFRPGVDDWQFPNHGSYISPGGHCTGQSLTAMWYYCEKKLKGAPKLYNTYDNNFDKRKTPGLWEDDTFGYRLASTVQEDIDFEGLAQKLTKQLAYSDELTYDALLYAMMMTGEPQEVGIYSQVAGGGHDMVLYKISYGTLHIADPNYPRALDRRIVYADGNFKPYDSGANAQAIAQGKGKRYDLVQYCAKTATIDWGQIARRWAEFEKGTIGTDRFPPYILKAVKGDGTTLTLKDGLTTDERELTIKPDCQKVKTMVGVYQDGAWLEAPLGGHLWLEEVEIELTRGPNLLGIEVADSNGDWIDFKWVNVVYVEPTAIPPALPDLTVTSVSFLPTEGKVGDKISVTCSMKNQGGPVLERFSNRIFLAKTRWGTDYSLGSFDMEPLNPGESRPAIVTTSPIPSDVPAGSYWVTVFTDGSQKIKESNEDNNIGSSDPLKFTVTAPAPTPTPEPETASTTVDSITPKLTAIKGGYVYWYDVEASGTARGPVLTKWHAYIASGPGATSVQASSWRVLPGAEFQRGQGDEASTKWTAYFKDAWQLDKGTSAVVTVVVRLSLYDSRGNYVGQVTATKSITLTAR